MGKNVQTLSTKKKRIFKHNFKSSKAYALHNKSNLLSKNINFIPKGRNIRDKYGEGGIEIVKNKSDFIQKSKSNIMGNNLEGVKNSANRNKFFNILLNIPGNAWGGIKSNPCKTAIILAVLMYGGIKTNDMLGNDAKVFDELKSFVRSEMSSVSLKLENDKKYKNMKEEFSNDETLEFLFILCAVLKNKLDDPNYSKFRAGVRMVLDTFFIRGATIRQRKSVQRLMSIGKGACWEAAFTFDFCLRMLKELNKNEKVGRHHIVVSHLSPSIYHTFNLFEFDGSWYFCDPLAGVMGKITDASILNHNYLRKYIDRMKGTINAGNFYNGYDIDKTLNLYVLEQINQNNNVKPLGMMKMASFMKSDKDDSFIIQDKNNQYVKNIDENVKFSECSSLLFG